jgi:hypothetical protein
MKSVHNFLDARRKIPIMDIEQIDVSRLQALERALDGEVH